MRSGIRLRSLGTALVPALVLACALPLAAAAHGHGHGRAGGFWHHGFWQDDAALAGTVTSVASGSLSASAHVVTPGPGNSGATPANAPVTITIGADTKVIAYGRSGIVSGDDFYAIYRGVSAGTPLSTLAAATPSLVVAYPAPTPEVEVRGVVTAAPASGSDSFVATARLLAPHRFRLRPLDGGTGGGTPGTVITTDGATEVRVDGRPASVSDIAVGDTFTAVYDGTPSEPLSTITSTPVVSLRARTAESSGTLYAFVGSVANVDTTAGTVTVNVTSSIPTGLFSGADTFTVGPQTMVLGDSSGSLTGVSQGDVVAGGLIAPSGESAGAAAASPLQVLVDFPASSAAAVSSRRAERRALELLRRERALFGHHHKSRHGTHQR